MQRQIQKNPKKRKPEHSPARPKKKIKSSNQKKSKSKTPQKEVTNLPDISEIIKQKFIYQPLDQNPYQHLLQMAKNAYQFTLEKSQWISPQLIRYKPLDIRRFVLVGSRQLETQPQPQPFQLYLQKSEKMMSLIESYLKNISYLINDPPHYFRGPSGIGKSHGLIQWILENRKRDNIRILHMILDTNYLLYPCQYFAYDFIYCFHKDIENPDFPKPPDCEYFKYNQNIMNGENWFKFLRYANPKDANFLSTIVQYLYKKEIASIFIWDQDNIFQKNKIKDPFLISLRTFHFNFSLISASNTNEGFDDLNENDIVIEQNVGFSQDESNEYLINVLERLYGNEYSIDKNLLENIYQLTNGNGYYLSKFVYSQKGENYQEKFKFFINDMNIILEAQVDKFFEKKIEAGRDMWLAKYPELLCYLDVDYTFPIRLFSSNDKNFTYIENSKLKSVNNFAREVFIKYYSKMMKLFKKKIDFLSMLKQESNPVLIGIFYERYIIQEFLQKFVKDDMDDESYDYTLENNVSEKIQCQILDTNFFLSFSNEDIKDILKNKKNSCLIKPAKFNNPVFDFIIWDAKKEFLYVFQITINEKHNTVDENFFTYEKYSFLRNHKNVRFIWITNKPNFQSKYKNESIGYIRIMF